MWLGIDLGTQSVKAVVMMPDGAIAATESQPYPVCSPQIGWAETPPQDWWQAVGRAV